MDKRIIFSVWLPQGISRCLSSATRVALSLYLYQVTQSEFVLSSVLSLSMLASIYFSPIAGGIADHISKRSVLFYGSILSAILALTQGFGAIRGPIYWLLYVSIFSSGIINSVVIVTLQSLVREISEDTQLVRANSLISLIQNAPMIAGPALGAVLYASINISIIVAINALSFVFAGLAAYIVLPRLKSEARSKSWLKLPFKGAKDGFSILWNDRDMRNTQLCYSLVNLGNGFAAGLISPYIIEVANRSNLALGSYGSLGSISAGHFLGRLLLGTIESDDRLSSKRHGYCHPDWSYN